MTVKYMMILALIPSISLATTTPPEPTPTTATSSSTAVSTSTSESTAIQTQYTTSAANTSGNTTTVTNNQVRQVGALGMGSVIPPGCGSGANAGGAGTGATGALGFSWTTKECHGWQYIATLAALGLHKEACEALKTQDAAKRAKKRGAPEIDCNALSIGQQPLPESKPLGAPSVQAREVQAAAPPQECATEAQLERAFRTCVNK